MHKLYAQIIMHKSTMISLIMIRIYFIGIFGFFYVSRKNNDTRICINDIFFKSEKERIKYNYPKSRYHIIVNYIKRNYVDYISIMSLY